MPDAAVFLVPSGSVMVTSAIVLLREMLKRHHKLIHDAVTGSLRFVVKALKVRGRRGRFRTADFYRVKVALSR